MARTGSGGPAGLPDCLKKRRLLHERELSPEVCRRLGKKFFSLAWWEDALDFFRKGQIQEGLERLKNQAVASGDAHLLSRLGEKDPAVWRALAAAALAQGKLHFALKALKAAGDEAGVADLEARLGQSRPPQG